MVFEGRSLDNLAQLELLLHHRWQGKKISLIFKAKLYDEETFWWWVFFFNCDTFCQIQKTASEEKRFDWLKSSEALRNFQNNTRRERMTADSAFLQHVIKLASIVVSQVLTRCGRLNVRVALSAARRYNDARSEDKCSRSQDWTKGQTDLLMIDSKTIVSTLSTLKVFIQYLYRAFFVIEPHSSEGLQSTEVALALPT